ncbi:MAG: carbon-nitrogen family hydrolase [bacterium]|nr:carbon-nitrogen family hydrolase [bacterium]
MIALNIALVQMDVKIGKKEENIKKAEKLLKKCEDFKLDIICFPELFTTGYDLENISNLAESSSALSLKFITEKARKLSCYILAGSIAEKNQDRIYNTSFLIDNQGQIIGKYSKINLFPPFKEDLYFEKGKEVSLSKIKIKDKEIWVGILICYDLRFPTLFQKLTQEGAQIIFVPSQFPNPRIEHWKVLLKARAIENQVYIIGINRIGNDSEVSYFGHSMVIDPWGEVVGNALEEEGVLFAKIDLDRIAEAREKIPVWKNVSVETGKEEYNP